MDTESILLVMGIACVAQSLWKLQPYLVYRRILPPGDKTEAEISDPERVYTSLQDSLMIAAFALIIFTIPFPRMFTYFLLVFLLKGLVNAFTLYMRKGRFSDISVTERVPGWVRFCLTVPCIASAIGLVVSAYLFGF